MFKSTPTLIGKSVVLTKSVKTCSGIFEKGTIMKVTGSAGSRGYDLQDELGNNLLECASSNFDLLERKPVEKHLYLIRNNHIHEKACYWDGFGWVERDKAMFFIDSSAAEKLAVSIYEFGKVLSQVIVSDYNAVD